MANPQKENGYTAIANEIIDALCKIRIPGEERQVLDAVFRKTYGWQKCEDKISMGQIAKMTGLKRQNVCRSIHSLSSKKILTVIKTDDRDINTLKFNKNYEEWVLSKRITVIKADDRSVIKSDSPPVIKSDAHKRKNIKQVKQYSDDFLSFYKSYPRKVGRDAAWKAWQKRNGDRPSLEKISEVLEWHKKNEWKNTEIKYIPHPATWINSGRWNDEIPEKTGW